MQEQVHHTARGEPAVRAAARGLVHDPGEDPHNVHYLLVCMAVAHRILEALLDRRLHHGREAGRRDHREVSEEAHLKEVDRQDHNVDEVVVHLHDVMVGTLGHNEKEREVCMGEVDHSACAGVEVGHFLIVAALACLPGDPFLPESGET